MVHKIRFAQVGWIRNDHVYQSANIICCKHNIHSFVVTITKETMSKKKKKSLLAQSMKLNIPSNGGEKNSNYIM
jgi:hypothetical protein